MIKNKCIKKKKEKITDPHKFTFFDLNEIALGPAMAECEEN